MYSPRALNYDLDWRWSKPRPNLIKSKLTRTSFTSKDFEINVQNSRKESKQVADPSNQISSDVSKKETEIEHLIEKYKTLEQSHTETKLENKRVKAMLEEIKGQKCELEKAAERTNVLLETLERDKIELEERDKMAEERISELETRLVEAKAAHESVFHDN